MNCAYSAASKTTLNGVIASDPYMLFNAWHGQPTHLHQMRCLLLLGRDQMLKMYYTQLTLRNRHSDHGENIFIEVPRIRLDIKAVVNLEGSWYTILLPSNFVVALKSFHQQLQQLRIFYSSTSVKGRNVRYSVIGYLSLLHYKQAYNALERVNTSAQPELNHESRIN